MISNTILRVGYLFSFVTSILAANPYQAKLSNSKDGAFHDFPLGVLAATGRLTDGETSILIKDMGKQGAAHKGGLQVGDRIVTIQGHKPEPFSKKTDLGLLGPQYLLGTTLDKDCSLKRPALALKVLRGEAELEISIDLPPSPAFSDTFPYNCKKSQIYLLSIANHLAAIQRKDGSWRPGVGGDADVYMGAFCGLTLLAANQKNHLPNIRKAIGFLLKKSTATIKANDPMVGPKNWQATTTAMLLAEYQLATGDKTYFPQLKKTCDLLTARVSKDGTMGHHYSIPYNGGGLVIINAQAHIAWALAEKCGYPIDRKAWNRSLQEVRDSIDPKTGAIGYSSRARWSPDIAARTGAMALALSIAGEEKALTQQFARVLAKYDGRMRHAHAMSSIGLLYGIPAIQTRRPKEYRDVMRRWIPYFELSRTAEGPATYFGGKRNIGGDQYLGLHPIGNCMVGLVLASSERRLIMHGGRSPDWFGK